MPITGVATSTALFIGWTTTGPTERAVRVSSFADYERTYGVDERALVGYAVQHYFDNGGNDAYVVRLAAQGDAASGAAILSVFERGGLADAVDLFNLVCVPGISSPEIIHGLQRACARRRAFLIADCREDAQVATAIADAQSLRGEWPSHAAFYFPWIKAPDPLGGGRVRSFPPCGAIAGMYARTDAARGIWEAPAGADARLVGAVGLAVPVNSADVERLNPHAVNCLRTLAGYGTVVWGARTLDGADLHGSDWKYVPVRRLSLFLEESIDRGTRWVVSEHNDEALWGRLRDEVGGFMVSLFRGGAFAGRSPRDAYFVKCDRETMTQNDINDGVVHIVVGFAPLKPAEFVVLRIQQLTRGTPG